MSMSDEQFESEIKKLPWGLCKELRARDTAQREALARVEAERDVIDQKLLAKTGAHEFLKYGLNNLVKERDTTQEQLAEAVGLLRKIDSEVWPEWDRHGSQAAALINVKAFLANYDQAEQQEAQGAQAGDERAAFRKEYDAFRQWAGSRLTARQLDLDEVGLFYDEVAGFAHDAWQARAALATQPAAGTTSDQYRAELYEEVWQKARDMGYGNVTDALVALERVKATQPAAGEPVAFANERDLAWHGSEFTVQRHGPDSYCSVPLYTAPPAAAHGDEAVQKDDRAPGLEWAINKCTAMQEHGFDRVRLDLFKRDLEGALAAMRAQGDGG